MAAYAPITWTNEALNGATPLYTIRDQNGAIIATNATIELVNLLAAGTPVNAQNLNHLETGVQNAQAAGDQGISDAAAAQATANTASASATAAQNSANTGIANAATAQTAANNAKTAADAAQAAANAAIPKSTIQGAGDLIVGSGVAAPTRLAKGSNQQGLMVDGSGNVVWGNALGAIAITYGGPISIPNASYSTLTLSDFDYRSGINYSDGVSLRVPYAGVYLVTAYAEWAANATGYRQLGFYMLLNSTPYWFLSTVPGINSNNPFGTNTQPMIYSGVHYISSSVILSMAAYQNSGVSLNLTNIKFSVIALH